MQFNSLKIIKTIKQEYLALAVFAFLVFAFYGNTLFNGFVLDDSFIIEQNPQLRSWGSLHQVITSCPTEDPTSGCQQGVHYYSPLQGLTNFLTYQISSGHWIFHLANLIYFIITVFLTFILIKLITDNFAFAFFAALIFLIHPINIEVVNWASAAPMLLMVIFILLALIFYIRNRDEGLAKNFFLAVLFYFFAILSKESAVLVVPFLMLAADAFIFKIPIKKIFSRARMKKYAFLAVPVVAYFAMRIFAIGAFSGIANKGGDASGFSFLEKINVFFTLFIHSVKTILYPYPSLLFHDFKIDNSLLNGRFLLSFLVFASLAAIFCILAKKGKSIIAFSLVWIYVFFFHMLLFFYVAGENIFAERFLFGANIGLAILAAYPLALLWQKKLLPKDFILPALRYPKMRRLIATCLTIFLIIGSWLIVFPQNKEWKNTVTLLRANLARTPDAYHLQESLADEFRRVGDIESAKMEYEKIIAGNPGYKNIDNIYDNLAGYYRENKELAKAEEYYKKSIEASKGKNYKSYNNLGAFYAENGNRLKALINFCVALRIKPEASEPQRNLNMVASMIVTMPDSDLRRLYDDIAGSDVFQKSDSEKIKYNKRTCSEDGCSFIFASELEVGEILFPFMILGAVPSGNMIRIENPSFDPQTNEIILEIDSQYEDQTIIFIFPTCEGKYYEAIAS